MSERMVEPVIDRDATGIRVDMPVAPNGVLVFLGFGVALPWLLVFAVGSVVAPIVAPPDMRRTVILGVIAANLLFLIVHMLAAMGVWLAAYKLRGCERAVVTSEQFAVKRRALGITVPVKLGRTTYDVVELLDVTKTPGRNAHPRLEVRAGHSAVRFGAGLSAAQAEMVRSVLAEELSSRGNQADVSR